MRCGHTRFNGRLSPAPSSSTCRRPACTSAHTSSHDLNTIPCRPRPSGAPRRHRRRPCCRVPAPPSGRPRASKLQRSYARPASWYSRQWWSFKRLQAVAACHAGPGSPARRPAPGGSAAAAAARPSWRCRTAQAEGDVYRFAEQSATWSPSSRRSCSFGCARSKLVSQGSSRLRPKSDGAATCSTPRPGSCRAPAIAGPRRDRQRRAGVGQVQPSPSAVRRRLRVERTNRRRSSSRSSRSTRRGHLPGQQVRLARGVGQAAQLGGPDEQRESSNADHFHSYSESAARFWPFLQARREAHAVASSPTDLPPMKAIAYTRLACRSATPRLCKTSTCRSGCPARATCWWRSKPSRSTRSTPRCAERPA